MTSKPTFIGGSIKEWEAREEEFRRNTLFINLMEGKTVPSISDEDAQRVLARLDAAPGDNKAVRQRLESQLEESKKRTLPKRTADTMSEAIALSSPSGGMSKRAREQANKRLSVSLFGERGLQRPQTPQPDESVVLKRQAVQLRELADRGMSPRKNRAAASKLEARIKTTQRGLDRA